MSSFREKLIRFMIGRYGVDSLSRCLSIIALVCLVLSIFIPVQIVRYILWGIGMVAMVYSYYRILSRNYPARIKEKQWFESVIHFKFKRNKTHKIFKCPSCAPKIRVPRHKGKICITCPKCRNEFIKKTWFGDNLCLDILVLIREN